MTTFKDLLAQVATLEATASQAEAKIATQAQQIRTQQAANAKLQTLLQIANANTPTQDQLDQAGSDATAANVALAGAVGDPTSVVPILQIAVDQTTKDLTDANAALTKASTPTSGA